MARFAQNVERQLRVHGIEFKVRIRNPLTGNEENAIPGGYTDGNVFAHIDKDESSLEGGTRTFQYELIMSGASGYIPKEHDEIIIKGVACSIYEVEINNYRNEMVSYQVKAKS